MSANQLTNPQLGLLQLAVEMARGWWWWWQLSALQPLEWRGTGVAVEGREAAVVSAVLVGKGVLTEEEEVVGPCPLGWRGRRR